MHSCFVIANVLDQMAKFDFKTPVKITLLFEDSDDDLEIVNENHQAGNFETEINNSTLEENSRKKNLQIETESQQNSKDSNETLLKQLMNATLKDLLNKTCRTGNQSKENELDKTIPNLQIDKPGNIFNEPVCKCKISSEASFKQPAYFTFGAQNKTRQTKQYVAHHHDHTTRAPLSLGGDLLNTLSENLISVMVSFYHYRLNKKDGDDYQKRKEAFIQLKDHYFELSYHTMVSIIIPQEHNKYFTNIFLQNTVTIANNKPGLGTCHRGHLEPIFIELLIWSKFKKSIIDQKVLNLGLHKEKCLSKPLRSNWPFSETTTTQRQPKTDNVCLFSSESTGVEVNVNREIFRDCLKTQNHNTVERQGVQNQNQAYATYQTGSTNRIKTHACDNQTNNAQNYNLKLNCRLTPYSLTHNSRTNPIKNKAGPIQGSRSIEHLRKNCQADFQLRQKQSNNEIHSSGWISAMNENINPQNMVSVELPAKP